MEEIKVGSTVQLKSGGPNMTVDEITGTGPVYARCSWMPNAMFSRRAGKSSTVFDVELLKLVEPDVV